MRIPRRSKFPTLLIALIAFAAANNGSAAEPAPSATKTTVFAGGCFWCMQPAFDHAKGVVKTMVGYAGGTEADAIYEKVSAHRTQHREVIEVTYDPTQISYDQLLEIFWRQVDPTQADGQFHDLGLSYQAAIFYGNEEEKKVAEASKEKLGKSGKFEKPIVTQILPAAKFYPAEDYHQKYYLKNPAAYEAYHVGSGRIRFLDRIWGEGKH